MWLAAILHQLHIGTLKTPVVGGFIFNPGSRFSDLRDVIWWSISGYPYGQVLPDTTTVGPAYPPGVFPAMFVFNELGVVGSQVAIIGSTAICLGLLCGVVLRRGRDRAIRIVSGVTVAAWIVTTSFSLDYYAVVLCIASSVAVLATVLGKEREIIESIAMPTLIGTCMPVVFAIDRLNIYLLVMQLVALSAVLVTCQRRTLAALAIGVAIALKTYPIWYLITDTYAPGRLRRMAVACVTGAGITIWGLLTTNYSLREAIDGFNRSVQYFEHVYIVQESGMPYGASLLTSLRIIYRDLGRPDHTALVASIYPEWKTLAPIAVGLVAVIVIAMRTPGWCRLMSVVCALMVFSPNTGMYRAAVLVVPVAMWLYEVRIRDTGRSISRWETALGVSIGVGLAPLTFWTVTGFPIIYLTSQTVLAPFAYGAVMVLARVVGMQRRGVTITGSRRHHTRIPELSHDPTPSQARAATP